MRAAVCRAYGPPDGVVVDEFPAPEIGSGQVRVRVHAAAVNFPDVLIVADDYQMTAPLPFVPGSEFAGEVTEVADDVDTVAVGDRVFGTAFIGAFAEEIVVGASALTPIPPGVADETAAAFGVAHRTAYHVLRSVARVQPGEELVVLGAGGGVGLAAVQLGVELGARVTAVASSPEKLEAAAAAGGGRADRPPGRRPPSGPAGAPSRTAPTSSSTRSAVTWPSPPCVRCGGRAGS